MQNFHDIIIIGAGPIGLYLGSLCEKSKLDYIILEASNIVGGQISHLYPEKEIVDIPNIKSIKAIDFVKDLENKIDSEKIIFGSNVNEIKKEEKIELSTEKARYFCNKLVIVTGLGSSTPRPLGVEGEKDCKNIIYSIGKYDFLKGKKVAIFGGGDSALDWAKTLSMYSDNIHLIHRRTEFRGNPETIKNSKNLKVHLPFVPLSIKRNDSIAQSVTIKNVETEETLEISVDYIFVNFGNVASQSKFDFPTLGAFLLVDQNNKVAENIYAIGDVCQYENKTRRLAPGISEANKVFDLIKN